MRFLNDNQKRTLTAFCDTIHPPGADAARLAESANELVIFDASTADPFTLSASELGIADVVEKALADRDKKTREDIKLLLSLLNRRVVNGFLAGHWAPFDDLSLRQRTEVLQALAQSQFNTLRGAFQSVKRLVSFLCYTMPRATKGNPFWQAFDYQGRANQAGEVSDALPVMLIESDRSLQCDVLVIGSGAGGGVVAAELSAAGQSVIVAEKGNYFSNARLPATEIDGMRKLYEGHGSLSTADRGMIILAGSTLGGGTTVNWMTCLDPPPQVLKQWSREYGFSAATSKEFAHSIEHVSRRIHVTCDESPANFQNDILQRGCDALGYPCRVIPRNVNGCVTCDFCGFGCRYGAKQDTRRTFLRDAVNGETRIVVRAEVKRVLHQRGRVTGAEMDVVSADGSVHRVDVQCQRVVVAAGSIHTPALLRRSGLHNKNIGANLHLHPCGAIFASYEDEVHAWRGAPQTRLCDHFSDLDGYGYGVRLEASPAHPGLWALGLPWQSGNQHRHLMQQLPHLANTIVLTRDLHSGRIDVDANGKPVVHYKLHPYDARHMMTGIEQALRIHRAAGAEFVYGPHNDSIGFDCKNNASQRDFESFLTRVHSMGTRPNHFGQFCAHQMSSCRIADSPDRGVISPEGETYEVKNLYVADGSVLPTSTGVNPMITIMATAHHLAQQIKAKLPR